MARIVYKHQRVELETPYVQLFVDEMRSIPSRFRSWVPERRVWIVYSPYVDRAVTFTLNLFPSAEVVGTPTSETGNKGSGSHWEDNSRSGYWDGQHYGGQSHKGSYNASGGATTGGDHQTLYLTHDAPESVVKAAYKALAILYHPDRSTDPAATRKMQDVNAAYDRIKKVKGWK